MKPIRNENFVAAAGPLFTDGLAPTQHTQVLKTAVTDAAGGVIAVLMDNVDVAFAPHSINQVECEAIQQRFEESALVKVRTDGVPGKELGATQFGKTPEDFARECAVYEAEITRIAGGYDGIIEATNRQISAGLAERSVNLRPAVIEGRPAALGRAVNWKADSALGRFLLAGHDDWAQTQASGCEIADIVRVCALNFYVISKPDSGRLCVSSWTPSDTDRAERGIETTGYKYSEADLDLHPFLSVPFQSGDAAAVNGAKAHFVELGKGRIRDRLLFNVFYGLKSDGVTVIYWA